jgi:hypothetical protein
LRAQAGSGRISEAIIVPGDRLAQLRGASIDAVAVWIHDDGAWRRIRSQVDQRDENGQYVATEGEDALDSNDELVLLAADLGDEAPEDALPPQATGVVFHVRATDPLVASWSGNAYVTEGEPAPSEPLVSYDPATREIASGVYTVGLASPAVDGFLGIKKLAFSGETTNRIDRSKIRITIPQFGEFNEESLGGLGVLPPVEPVVVGPVRVVLSPTGGSFAYPARAAVTALDIPAEIPLIPGLEFRISLDLSPESSGAAYSDAYSLREHTVDGTPDGVQQLLLAPWRQVRFGDRRLVLLATGEPTPLLVRNYYKDDSTVDPADTGDHMSFGDTGVAASSLAELAAVGFLGEMVMLGPEESTSAPELAEQLANPLVVLVRANRAALYLPRAHR